MTPTPFVARAFVALLTTTTPVWAQVAGLDAALNATQGSPAQPAAAPAENVGEVKGPAALVSHFCPDSFFTNEGDLLDLRATRGTGCFDTGRGRDVFRLQPSDFPDGTTIVSDRGRSVLRSSDAPALVFDQESTAEEIRTGPNNDVIRLGLGFVEGANFVHTPLTEVFPGGGEDLIVVGSGARDAQAPRFGANTRVFPGQGVLALEAGCGRMTDPDTIDVSIEGARSDSRVYVESQGCGVALRDHAASTTLHQRGGRTAVGMGAWEEPFGPVFFDALVEESSGLSWSVTNPSEASELVWSGFGSAAIHTVTRDAHTGGRYEAKADGTVFVRAQVGEGAPAFDVLASERTEVVVEGEGQAQARVTMSAPVMRVEWRPVHMQAPPPMIVVSGGGQISAQPFGVKRAAAANLRASAPLAMDKVESVPHDEVASTDEGTGGAQAPQPEAVASSAQEPTPAQTPPAEVEVTASFEGRDGVGRTQAGREALLGGHPVGAVRPTGSTVQAWVTEPVFVTANDLVLTLTPPMGWCQSVRISGGVMGGERVFACSEGGRAALGVSDTITITKTDGTTLDWPLEGLEYPGMLRFVLAPAG